MRYLICLLGCLVSSFSFALNPHTYIPPNGYLLKPVFETEIGKVWPGIPDIAYPETLGEQESCVSLTSPRCLNPKARLKTDREEGAGIPQLTRTFDKKTGAVKMDVLTDLSRRYSDLGELNWETAYTNPGLQIRAMLHLLKDTYRMFPMIKDPFIRLQFTDPAYNGGARDTLAERMACGLKKDCNPNLWFGHVEKTCLKSTKPLYGTRSPCLINREHPEMVFHVRLPKYQRLYANDA